MSKAKKKIQTETKIKIAPEKAVLKPSRKWYKWLVLTFSFLLYAQTISYDYTQDDAIVIYDNMFTQEGISGIPGLLSNDTFYGFFKTEGKAKLVSGGRYRPLTPVLFAIEYQFFGRSPLVSHLFNVGLYAILCMLIYLLLVKMLSPKFGQRKGFYLFALLTALLFAAHPIHTEAVANIKGRDEILSMMGAILSLYLIFKYLDGGSKLNLLWAGLSFFLGLMSKETTITFLAVIPLAIYFFRSVDIKKAIAPFLYIACATILFLIIRTSILGFDFGGAPKELMNNPYLKIEGNMYVPFSFAEKSATIIYTLGRYIGLLIFPHPLTHDYYPRHIEIMSWSNLKVIFSLFLYLILGILALIQFRKKSIYSFSILYFIITLSIVSNIIFPIGTNMSERFMFMPSLGFCLAISYFIYSTVSRFNLKLMITVGTVLLLLFSIKTIIRNEVWKDDFTLFTTDVKTSTNSAKVLNAAGGALVTESAKPENSGSKTQMLDTAIPYLNKALQIHPNYKNAALLLGNAYFYKNEYDNAITSYERALSIAPEYAEATKNLAIAYRDAGRHAGEQLNDLNKAKQYLKRSIQLVDGDPDAYRLLGITHGMAGEHLDAIKYFTKVTEMLPDNAGAFVNLGKAYQYSGDEELSKQMFQKALSIDPKALESK